MNTTIVVMGIPVTIVADFGIGFGLKSSGVLCPGDRFQLGAMEPSVEPYAQLTAAIELLLIQIGIGVRVTIMSIIFHPDLVTSMVQGTIRSCLDLWVRYLSLARSAPPSLTNHTTILQMEIIPIAIKFFAFVCTCCGATAWACTRLSHCRMRSCASHVLVPEVLHCVLQHRCVTRLARCLHVYEAWLNPLGIQALRKYVSQYSVASCSVQASSLLSWSLQLRLSR